MIEYINRRLNDWADWCIKGRRVVGLGYPSRASFYRLARPPNAITPLPEEDCWQIEQAVHRLDARHKAVIEQFYLHTGTVETHAKALRVCRDTLYVRLHRAHVSIMEWLQVGDEDFSDKRVLTASDRTCTKSIS